MDTFLNKTNKQNLSAKASRQSFNKFHFLKTLLIDDIRHSRLHCTILEQTFFNRISRNCVAPGVWHEHYSRSKLTVADLLLNSNQSLIIKKRKAYAKYLVQYASTINRPLTVKNTMDIVQLRCTTTPIQQSEQGANSLATYRLFMMAHETGRLGVVLFNTCRTYDVVVILKEIFLKIKNKCATAVIMFTQL